MDSQHNPPPVVAILNTNDDTVEMLRMMLEMEGMVAVSAHVNDIKRGELDFGSFLREHDPKVVIVDIPPPYDRSWLLTQHLRAMPAAIRSSSAARSCAGVLRTLGKAADAAPIAWSTIRAFPIGTRRSSFPV